MQHRRLGALTRTVLSAILIAAGAPAPAATLEHVGTFVWTDKAPSFGGFSGIEVSPDGQSFHAVSDRSFLYWGSFLRDPSGRIADMQIDGRAHLRDSHGVPLKPGYLGDSEGLAIAADGTIWVTFEGLDRIISYDTPDSAATTHPRPPDLPGMRINSGLEALAIRDDGTIFAIPERSANEARPFPLLTFRNDEWRKVGEIRRDPRWLAVGADFGPDGWLYLLERDFKGILGFTARVRRFQITDNGPQNEEILLETRQMQYDNLEGIAVWQDDQGIRLTMISDDNFLILQRTELVEYRLRD